ncbi:unnamed protein product, partial [Polarella glacialis]
LLVHALQTLAFTGLTLLALSIFVAFGYCRLLRSNEDKGQRNVTVLVLGDIGRSPRMQYHALSLARHGCSVSLVGYPGAQPMNDIMSNPRIRLWHIMPLELPQRIPFTLRAILK